MIEPMGNRGPRDGKGKYVPRPDSEERDAEAFRMRTRACTLAEIQVALGYSSPQHVSTALKRHIERRVGPAADEYRAVMDAQLDHMYREVTRVLETTHYKVNNGTVVYFNDDECQCQSWERGSCSHAKPLLDDSPVLAAVDRLVKIQESRRKLYGLDAPVKHDVSVSSVTVRVEGADDV